MVFRPWRNHERVRSCTGDIARKNFHVFDIKADASPSGILDKTMAFRFERGESVFGALKRVVCEEIEAAGDGLSGGGKTSRDEAIHEARKSIKKVRAVLRLVRRKEDDAYSIENARLRDIAGRLSGFRDDVAIVETLDDLTDKYKDEAGPDKLRSVHAGLTKQRDEAGREERIGGVLHAAAAALREVSKRLKIWSPGAKGYRAIAPGLERSYRSGRKALARARKDPRPENFHELRKRVKDHWYHVRLLEDLWSLEDRLSLEERWSRDMSARETHLKHLETWLGNDHNLVVLQGRIVAAPSCFGHEKDVGLTLRLIGKYRNELRGKAIPLAERVYDGKPREFSRHMKHLWDSWEAAVAKAQSKKQAHKKKKEAA